MSDRAAPLTAAPLPTTPRATGHNQPSSLASAGAQPQRAEIFTSFNTRPGVSPNPRPPAGPRPGPAPGRGGTGGAAAAGDWLVADGRPGGDWLLPCLCSAAATAAGQRKFECGGGGGGGREGRWQRARPRLSAASPDRSRLIASPAPEPGPARPGGSMDLENKVKKVRSGPPAGAAGNSADGPLPPEGRTDGRGPVWPPPPVAGAPLGSSAPAARLLPLGLHRPVLKGEGGGSCLRNDLLVPRSREEGKASPLIKALQFVPQVANRYPCPTMQALLSGKNVSPQKNPEILIVACSQVC